MTKLIADKSNFRFGLSRFKDSLSEAQKRREAGTGEGCCSQSWGWSEARLASWCPRNGYPFDALKLRHAQDRSRRAKIGNRQRCQKIPGDGCAAGSWLNLTVSRTA